MVKSLLFYIDTLSLFLSVCTIITIIIKYTIECYKSVSMEMMNVMTMFEVHMGAFYLITKKRIFIQT